LLGPLVAVSLAVIVLAACNVFPTAPDGDNDDPGKLDVFEKIRSIDLLPRFPRQERSSEANVGKRGKPAVYIGNDQPTAVAPVEGQAAASGEGYDLNFETTPIASVAKVILGDILGVGYTIDPRVQGAVSLASGRPVPRSNIIFVLENALRMSNVALLRDNSGYRLVPLPEAVGAGATDPASRTEPGYGVSVVPLQYVSAPTLIKLMENFVSRPGMVRADAGRNLILIQGSSSERRNAMDAVLTFDADWMRGQSVGIFPVQNSSPEPVIAELEKIVDSGENGLSQNLVKLQPIARMNAVLAVTRKPELLRTVETWVRRLDNADRERTGVHVYSLKYRDARQVASVLNSMFGTGGASSSSLFDTPANQLAPGSGLATISSSSAPSAVNRLSAGGQPTTSSFGNQPGTGLGTGLGTTPQGGLGLASNAQSGANLSDTRGGLLGGSSSGTPILQGVRITPDAANNALLIYASQENYTIIERTLRQIDRPQLQVGIDATVAEVTLNDNLSYGVQFFLTSHNLGLPPDRGSILNTTATAGPSSSSSTTGAVGAVTGAVGAAASTFISRTFPGFNFLVGPEAQPNVILDALHGVTDVKVLSNPSLVVIDNQVATLQVGDSVPISTGSATVLTTNNTVVNTIDYRNTGIILHVLPRINANGNVRLDIEQEISNVPQSSVGSLTPTVSERKVQSSISVASGQTVLLAGLISEQQSGGRTGIPILDQIPGIGNVFSSTTQSITRTELIIFIRPQIIRDSVDAHFVAEELRTKLRGTIGAVGSSPSGTPRVR
jgi:general secretion pathway protein D